MHSLDYVEFADLVLPGGISAGARSMLEAVMAPHVTCARQDRRSRSPHRIREFGIPQRLKNPEIPVGGPRAACENLELDAMSNELRLQWLEDARVNAILGSCKQSLKSVQSGWRAFRAFAGVNTCLFAAEVLALFVLVLQKAHIRIASGCCHHRCHCCWLGRPCLDPKEHCQIIWAT